MERVKNVGAIYSNCSNLEEPKEAKLAVRESSDLGQEIDIWTFTLPDMEVGTPLEVVIPSNPKQTTVPSSYTLEPYIIPIVKPNADQVVEGNLLVPQAQKPSSFLFDPTDKRKKFLIPNQSPSHPASHSDNKQSHKSSEILPTCLEGQARRGNAISSRIPSAAAEESFEVEIEIVKPGMSFGQMEMKSKQEERSIPNKKLKSGDGSQSSLGDGKPHKCTTCPKAYSCPSNLLRHIRQTHEMIKDFPCTICSKAYSCPSNLLRHIRQTHKMVEGYPCTTCPIVFLSWDSLQRHISTYHSRNPFHCQSCFRGFSRRDNLNRHVRLCSFKKNLKTTLNSCS